jgi:hypothetical protein
LAAAISRATLNAEDLAHVRDSLASLAATSATRLQWLRALAVIDRGKVLADARWWKGASLAELADLGQDELLGPVLARYPRVGDIPIVRALRAQPPEVGTVLALPLWLLGEVDADMFADAVDRLEAGHPLRSLIDRRAVRAIEAEKVEGERRLRETTEAHAAEMDHVKLELDAAKAEITATEAHAVGVAARLREAIDVEQADHAGRRRQDRLDALIAIAKLAAEVERSISSLTEGALTADEMLDAVLRQAGDVGVLRDAAVGAVVDLDRSKYRLLGDDGRSGGPVVVVEPAFLTHEGGTMTLLLFGKATAQVVADEAGGKGERGS